MKFGMHRSKLLIRLLATMLPLFIISLGILASLSYYYSNQFLNKSVDETAMSVGSDYANQTQATINDLVIQMEDLATTSELHGTDKKQIAEVLEDGFHRIGKFTMMNFVFLDGSNIRADGKPGYLGDRDYFHQVVSSRKLVLSKPLIAKTTGKMSIVIAVPVIDNGVLKGVLAYWYFFIGTI
jgi:hypothetical protein